MHHMTQKHIQTLVTQAVLLDRELTEKGEQLKALKAELVEAARKNPKQFTTTDGGGCRWSATGDDGCIARVNFPAPSLKAKIDGEGKTIEKIKEVAGRLFTRLFVPAVSYKPIPDFRDEVIAQLPKAEANKLIKLCQTESAPRVSFETADKANEKIAA